MPNERLRATLLESGYDERTLARVRMALSYYAPLAGVPGVDFLLQKETLYNSIFAYDDEMLVNQHVYGMYGYMCPILHLRRMEGGDFFDMYIRSFERVWEVLLAPAHLGARRGAGRAGQPRGG
jgi:hypothetical protein